MRNECEQWGVTQVSSPRKMGVITSRGEVGISACRRVSISTTQVQIRYLVCALKGALWPGMPSLTKRDGHFQNEIFPSQRTRVQETWTSLRFPEKRRRVLANSAGGPGAGNPGVA